MIKSESLASKDQAQKWILLGMPALCMIGCVMHFVYEWSGNQIVVGIFAR